LIILRHLDRAPADESAAEPDCAWAVWRRIVDKEKNLPIGGRIQFARLANAGLGGVAVTATLGE
jgi:hypothetical protein